LSCRELGFFLSSYGFVGKTTNKFNHIEIHIHPLPCKEKLERRRRINANEGLGPLNFLDFLSIMGHMKVTTFWSKGGG
jgi:hypothetical protein